VDCMIALPGQLFCTTQIPACLWFVTRNKQGVNGAKGFTTLRDRRGEVLFINARKLGNLVDRTHRELPEAELTRIAATYHAWRGEPAAGDYADVAGFCRSATLAEVESHGYVLTPGRYVGAEEVEEDDEPFAEKMLRLTTKLETQFAESSKLEAAIRENLRRLGL
jgi:type I restriction enzyme M protein